MPFRIRSILAASDLSPSESPVLRSASALAALAESELHVVHAVESDGATGDGGPRMEDRLRKASDALSDQLRGAIPRSAEVASSRVWPGRPHEVILQRARDIGADLVVLGPHRQGAERREVLGTTADRLVRTSEVPCMIVRGPISLPLRRVLVPTDLSSAGGGALDLALIWSTALRLPTGSDRRTRLDVLHVLPSEPTGPAGSSARDAAETDLKGQVDGGCRRTGCGGGLDVVRDVVEGGAPADEILRMVDAGDMDLLVMGTHGEGDADRALIGSVSSAVARRATCPVLLCPPPLSRELQGRDAGPVQGGGRPDQKS